MQIDVPDAINNTQSAPKKPNSESGKPAEKIIEENSKSTEGSDGVPVGKMTPSNGDVQNQIASIKIEEKKEVAKVAEQQKPKGPALKVPNYFQNMKIVEPEKFLKYRKIVKPGESSVIPSYYIHHIDRANQEKQKTEEKFWSFKKKMYEITEASI